MNIEQLTKDIYKNRVNIKVDGVCKTVYFDKFCIAMKKMLVEFGYNSLTAEEVEQQMGNIASGKEVDVIGMFIKGYLDY